MKTLYGLTLADFNDLLSASGNTCPICHQTLNTDDRRGSSGACVDHCHETGAIRGVICNLCNKGIGCLRDSPEIVANAYAYLTSRQEDTPHVL